MDKQEVKKLVEFITNHGNIDGDHHKMWVIDQILRKLCGDKYEKIIKDLEEEGYEWDVGIPP